MPERSEATVDARRGIFFSLVFFVSFGVPAACSAKPFAHHVTKKTVLLTDFQDRVNLEGEAQAVVVGTVVGRAVETASDAAALRVAAPATSTEHAARAG